MRTSLRASSVLATLVLAAACGGGDSTATGPEIGEQLPAFALGGAEGTETRFAFPSGRVQVFGFALDSCDACRAVVDGMARLDDELLGEPEGRPLELVTIATDGAVVPQDAPHWTFATAVPAAVLAICGDTFGLDVTETRGAGCPLATPLPLVLVDSLGRVRGRFAHDSVEGLTALRRDLRAVAAEPRHIVPGTSLGDPPFDITWPRWLAARAAEQAASMSGVRAFHDFRFHDRAAESGIAFRQQPTPDGTTQFKLVHYDHGNGVVSADVDGDGRQDLYFVNQVGRNELWRNRGGGRFEDVTDRAGVAVDDRIGVTASFCDVDNDGDPDLYVTAVRDGNLLFLNDGTGRFTDVTETSGLGHSGHSSSPVFFDYDRDGLTDLFLTNVGVYTTDELAPAAPGGDESGPQYWVGLLDAFSGHLKPERNERSLLFRNLGGARFEDVTAEVGLDEISWAGDATPFDVNEDGWPDLYVLDMQGNDDYFENVGGRSFVDRGREVFPDTPWGAMGVKAFDFDNDGHLDLYVTDMHSDMAEDFGPEEEKKKAAAMGEWPESLLRSDGRSVFGNAFYRNLGDGRFEEVSDAVNAENYWPWGLSVADLNADGYQDAFVCSSMNFWYRYGVNSLLLNERGERFVDAEFVLGVEPRAGGRTAKPWFALDCDGRDRGNPISQREGFFGDVVVWDALGSRSSVVLDIDADGDLDIVTTDFGSGPMVLVSDLSERAPDLSYLQVALRGTRSNRDGLGARVTVHAAGRALLQVHDGKSGYLSQSLLPLYFGLDGAPTVDRIEVSWPSGANQTVDGPLETNRTLEITEPE